MIRQGKFLCYVEERSEFLFGEIPRHFLTLPSILMPKYLFPCPQALLAGNLQCSAPASSIAPIATRPKPVLGQIRTIRHDKHERLCDLPELCLHSVHRLDFGPIQLQQPGVVPLYADSHYAAHYDHYRHFGNDTDHEPT